MLFRSGKVEHTLELPLHWRAPRLEAKWFMDQYERDDKLEPKLLQLAKLDFNRVQTVHQGEIGRTSRYFINISLDIYFFIIKISFYLLSIILMMHLRRFDNSGISIIYTLSINTCYNLYLVVILIN